MSAHLKAVADQPKVLRERLLIEDEVVLADIACIEPLAAHGILGLVNLGDTFLLCFYRWRAAKLEDGVLVREKNAAITILLPRSAAPPGSAFDTWLSSQTLQDFPAASISAAMN